MRAKIELKWKQRQNHQRVLKARLEQLDQKELWQTISSKTYEVRILKTKGIILIFVLFRF